jgi:hypothetical protein
MSERSAASPLAKAPSLSEVELPVTSASSARLPRLASSETVDVTLLLEGTYPYVFGGVSTWVHEIISGLPDVRFAAVFLGSAAEDYDAIHYEFPPNLVHVEAHYLMGRGEHRSPPQRCKGPPPAVVARLHDSLRDTADGALPTLSAALAALGEGRTGITEPSFLHSRESWEFLCAMYRSRCADPSFVDYFWTVRTMHAPIFRLSDIARRLPPTRAVHAVSTGYAGLLGAILAARRRIPFVLTEHGIYTKERRIDLAQATWIKDPEGFQDDDGGRETSYLREL